MKKLLLILLSLGIIGSANAVSSADESFTSLCIADSSVGFNWEKNDWKNVNFTPGKYIAKRLKLSETKNYQCSGAKDRMSDYFYTNESINEPELSRYGCYIIKRFGDDFYDNFPIDCYETWSTTKRISDDIDPKLIKLKAVMCSDRNFFFSPNARFHQATLHGNVDNYSNYKDSLSLSEGKCSTL
jgi:hypothetical protein|tara:strand:+ start:13 stop:567 length:555 start_codon:yes stop_codon:yes gene_type:complete